MLNLFAELQWRYKVNGQYITKSVNSGTFFERSKLDYCQAFKLSAIWATQLSLNGEQIRTTMGTNSKGEMLSPTTIVDWYNFFREICEMW